MENEIIEGALPLEEEEAGADGLESEESGVETDETDENLQPNIDFDAELERERERLGKKIDKERGKRIEAEKNKGLSAEEVDKIIEEKLAGVEKRMQQSRAEMLAEKLAKTSAEKELIMLHYQNSIIPSGNLEEDIDMAFALANRKKVQGQISELKKAAEHKKNLNAGGSPGQPVEIKKQLKYTRDIIDAAKFAGITPEEFVKKEKNLN